MGNAAGGVRQVTISEELGSADLEHGGIAIGLPSDYLGVGGIRMTVGQLSDAEVEALFSGAELDADLAAVADVLARARVQAMPDPGHDYSALFAAAVNERRLTTIERYARDHEVLVDGLTIRIGQPATIAMAAIVMIIVLSGANGPSASATPGEAGT